MTRASSTYFDRHGFSLREGYVPNLHVSWGPGYRLFVYVCIARALRWSWLWKKG